MPGRGAGGTFCRRALFPREKHRILFLPSGQARMGEGGACLPSHPISTMR